MAARAIPGSSRRERSSAHDGFLRYRNFRWAKIASAICLVAIVAYLLIDVQPRPNGGSAEGYVLGLSLIHLEMCIRDSRWGPRRSRRSGAPRPD